MFSKISIVLAAVLSSCVIAAPISAASAAAAANFVYNTLAISGAAQFAMWVPTDGSAYSTSSIKCLNVGASSIGSCNIPSIDQLSVMPGYTCFFSGSTGWSGGQSGTSSTGWLPVSPPQNIVAAACVPS